MNYEGRGKEEEEERKRKKRKGRGEEQPERGAEGKELLQRSLVGLWEPKETITILIKWSKSASNQPRQGGRPARGHFQENHPH